MTVERETKPITASLVRKLKEGVTLLELLRDSLPDVYREFLQGEVWWVKAYRVLMEDPIARQKFFERLDEKVKHNKTMLQNIKKMMKGKEEKG